MSYQKAYTTQFHGLDDTLWNIDIYIEGYDARPVEIKLEGDEPCVIDWQETGKTDVVQSSTCTLRVSNESDRQMTLLMSDVEAAVIVSRDGKWYWLGHLDDAIYEEPYSFTKAYVTELTFSDFGILNRIPFTLKGRQSVRDIVWDCLDPVFGIISYNLYTSLLEPKSQQPITLDMLYINADRFEADADSWGATTTKREVLEEVLRPLGLRIVQKNAQLYIYDIEYLRDHPALQAPVVWKGTDAYLRGSETYGRFEVGFESDALETLADDGLDYDSEVWHDSERYFGYSYNEVTGDASDIGFYIETKSSLLQAKLQKSPNARFFRTRSVFSESNDIGIAWRIRCMAVLFYMNLGDQSIPVIGDKVLLGNTASCVNSGVMDVLRMDTGYLPLVPDRNKFQLRVNLDFLLSFRPNPFDDPPDEWAATQDYRRIEEQWMNYANVSAYMVPVILEVLGDSGSAVWHYENADYETVGDQFNPYFSCDVVRPFGINQGRWVAGAGHYGQMYLAYYNPDDEMDDPIIEKAWVTNRIASPLNSAINGTLYRVRDDGEYLPMPPVAGKLRLTVGDGILVTRFAATGMYAALFNNGFNTAIRWQMYRNPEISIVKADRREDGIDTETAYERDAVGRLASFSETVMAGTWAKGIAPSARGLLFNASGTVWEKLAKNGTLRTLQEHRLRCIEDQALHVQPVIAGTAELDPLFRAKLEASTPGVFLVTALRQNLHQATEHITMARIANVGNHDHEFAWNQPCCALEEEPFTFAWSQPHCTAEPHFSFGWGSPACVAEYGYSLEWEEMQPIID